MGKTFETRQQQSVDGKMIPQIEWNLSLNVGLIEDIKEKSGVDLDLLIQKPEEFSQLLMVQPKKLVELLWCICEEQAKRHEIDPRTFVRIFDIEVLDSAGNALIESILDFYPRSSAGRAIRNNLPRILKQMDDEIEMKVNRELNKVLSNKHIDTGESLESVLSK
jgi:hypothetical protein